MVDQTLKAPPSAAIRTGLFAVIGPVSMANNRAPGNPASAADRQRRSPRTTHDNRPARERHRPRWKLRSQKPPALL